MGLLVEGRWVDRPSDAAEFKGRFVRRDSAFRNWITPDGRPGPQRRGGFQAEEGRYHLMSAPPAPGPTAP